jgi:hypothetical protein
MGDINSSKMPKAKTITRKDDPDKVEMFSGGGLYANIAAKKKRIAAGSGEKMRKVGAKGSPKKKDFAAAAKTVSLKEGGKSRVNEAGNYTKPGLRKSIFERIKAGGKGGAPGQWSARKAQMMAQQYKKAGGGYKD